MNRKNFLPALILTGLLWTGLIFLIFKSSPQSFLLIILFYLLLFFANLFSFSLIFANSRRGLLLSIGITGFFFLKQLAIANILNLTLFIATLVSLEFYFQGREN